MYDTDLENSLYDMIRDIVCTIVKLFELLQSFKLSCKREFKNLRLEKSLNLEDRLHDK